jgi:GMP synthase (glutamine-hydrolysing)
MVRARILMLDAYPAKATEAMLAAGGRPTATVMFPKAFGTGVDVTTIRVAEGETLGHNRHFTDFDGIAMTGSPLGAYEERAEVGRLIASARAAFASGVPVWGSCFGLQAMCQALGGEVQKNPKGYEVGIGRRITVLDSQRTHPLFAGKPLPSFDAITYHQDEVVRLPAGARLLASNAVSEVQAIELLRDGGHFWGVQYHPEYDLAHIALLLRRPSADRLVAQGLARSRAEMAAFADDLSALGADPSRQDIAWRYGIGPEIYDQSQHSRELTNWLTTIVLPRRAERHVAA